MPGSLAVSSTSIQGVQAASGLAVGTVALLDPLANLESVPDRQVLDIDSEVMAFRAAVVAVQAEIGASSERVANLLPHDVREIFDAYITMLGGDSLLQDTLVRIRAGNWGPGAWRETISEHAQVFDRMEDPYLRARGEDIRELGKLVLLQLQPGLKVSIHYPERCVLVGNAVSIQDIERIPAGRLVGIVSRQGSTFSHATVLANALSIPAAVSVASLPFGLVEGDMMVVDGDEARIHVNPPSDVLGAFEVRIEQQKALNTQIREISEMPAQTLDRIRITMHANIGLGSDIDSARDSEAEGVGLYRTEYDFLLRDAFPAEEEQFQTYRKLLESFAPKPVTIRTLDVGGDKILSYLPIKEDNPYLGVRGIRFSLAHPEILMIQLRALLRANVGFENMRVMFPMVAKISELDDALDLLGRAHRGLIEEGQPAAKPQVGVMIEVPSAVFLTTSIATRVDFLSIGTNDLAQYVLASDRMNARVTTPDDFLHPAVLNAINLVIHDSHAQSTLVSVCGEMAGDPAGALVLLGLDVDVLSMAPVGFAEVQQVVRRFTLQQARDLAAEALEQESEKQVRDLLGSALEAAGLRKLTGT